ncbi:hypothetical protein JOM56_014136, partial [Amanita muscaria]
MPNIVGQYFPRRDDETLYPFYCACMLMLLKPWRDLHHDLKMHEQSWEEAFEQFMNSATDCVKFILSGIQYFHDCDTASK